MRRVAPVSGHRELPRSDHTAYPARYLLEPLRPLAQRVIRSRFEVRLHGVEHVPTAGPVIFASNHVAVADGPLLAIFAPRPVHALTKVEMFRGAMGRFLLDSGQIPLDRFETDPAAVKTVLRVLRDGGAVGIFPEGLRGDGELRRFHRGAAYFALVSGAPVVPVVQIGTRAPGGHIDSIPRRGDVVDLVFGEPFAVDAAPWPRTRETVGEVSTLLQQHMLSHLQHALALTGRGLPGPVPPGDLEPDSPALDEESAL